jgi:prepilin-type N-terminal cleavage/methylation domain-containing protein
VRARAGFTLIEMLAVILILGILATILLTQLASTREAAEVSATRAFLIELSGVIDAYEHERGDYPPSSFASEQGVDNAGTNVGVEALVVALFSRRWNAAGHGDALAERLENVDRDTSGLALTDFGNRNLLELVDAWKNPIAYLHHRDYETRGRPYLTLVPETGEEIQTEPRALRQSDERTGLYVNATRYQLLSAGPDGAFGTEDDVTPFERR